VIKQAGNLLAGAAVGFAGGLILTSELMTAEVGQAFWVITILAGAAVLDKSTETSFARLIVGTLPFSITLAGILVWTGAASMAYHVGWAIVVAHIPIPLSAATDREWVIRYGIFYLFLLVASPPAIVAAACGKECAVRMLASPITPPHAASANTLRQSEAIVLCLRTAICSGMFLLAYIARG
jgi:hypothetical protein